MIGYGVTGSYIAIFLLTSEVAWSHWNCNGLSDTRDWGFVRFEEASNKLVSQ